MPADANDFESSIPRIAPELTNDSRAIHARQAHVEKDHIGLAMRAQIIQGVRSIASGIYFQSGAAEKAGQEFAFVAVIFNEQSFSRLASRGSQFCALDLPFHAIAQKLEILLQAR